MELADRPLNDTGQIPAMQGNRRPYYSLIPLKEILGELLGTGPASKKVNAAYSGLIGKASELSLLMEMSIDSIGKLNAHGISTELLAEAIDRMRRGQVSITAGYDGEYGVIRVFPAGENHGAAGAELFSAGGVAVKKPPVRDSAHSAKKTRAGKSGTKSRHCLHSQSHLPLILFSRQSSTMRETGRSLSLVREPERQRCLQRVSRNSLIAAYSPPRYLP
jgi:hypothetical protein